MAITRIRADGPGRAPRRRRTADATPARRLHRREADDEARPLLGAARPHRPGPTITVVIPCRDDAGFLADCLAALGCQTRPPDRVIVVDNASSDDSAAVARRLGATVVEQPMRGVWPASAKGYDTACGLGLADTDVLARVDADSVPPPDWVERVAAAFAADLPAGIDLITGPALFYGGNRFTRFVGDHLYVGAMHPVLTPWLGHSPVFGSNFAMRAGVWRRIRDQVASDNPRVHDDLDLSIQLPPDVIVRFDRDLRMPVSARPFASWSALGTRLRMVATTFAVSWPLGAAWHRPGRTKAGRAARRARQASMLR